MPRIVGLDIGTYSVKATVWKSSGRNFFFEAQYSQPVPQDEDNLPSTASQLSALDRMVDANEDLTQGGNVYAAAWGSDAASLHRVSLPFTDMEQIKKTLQFAVEDEVPFELEDMVLGWRILSQDAASSILVGLAPAPEVSGFLSELASRKMDPQNVLLDAEVIASWSGEQTNAVIDIGHRRTLMVVGTNGVVVSSRVIDIGGWHLTRAIQKVLECSWEQAEHIKHGHMLAEGAEISGAQASGMGSYGALPAPARQKVDEVLRALMAEIRATLIAVEDNCSVSIEQIRLGGGGSQFGPMTSMLEKTLGVPVYCVVNEEQQPIDAPFLIADGIASHLTGGIATELIDLRQGDLAYRSGMNGLQALVTYGALALAVFTLVAGGWYVWQRSVLGGQIDEVVAAQNAIYEATLPGEKIRGPSKAMTLMSARILEAENRAAALGSGGEPRTVALIHDLTQFFPKPVDVTVDVLHLNITPNTIQMDAETTGFAEVAKVEESLRMHQAFSGATKSNEQKKRGKIEFTVQIPLDGTQEDG